MGLKNLLYTGAFLAASFIPGSSTEGADVGVGVRGEIVTEEFPPPVWDSSLTKKEYGEISRRIGYREGLQNGLLLGALIGTIVGVGAAAYVLKRRRRTNSERPYEQFGQE